MRNLENKKFWEVQYRRVAGGWGLWWACDTKQEALEEARKYTGDHGTMRVVRYDASTTIEVKT